MTPLKDRMCCDCVHCDVPHSWCFKRNAKTSPLVIHPKDRVCPDYYDFFQAGEDGYYRQNEIEHTFYDVEEDHVHPYRGLLTRNRMKIDD